MVIAFFIGVSSLRLVVANRIALRLRPHIRPPGTPAEEPEQEDLSCSGMHVQAANQFVQTPVSAR